MSQSDNEFNKFEICLNDTNYMISFYENYTKFCKNLCPVDCIDDEFLISCKDISNKNPGEDPNFWKFTLFWDNTKPLVINKETPVMTFTDYFCYI